MPVARLLALSLALGGVAQAQIKHNDYTVLSSKFGSQSVQPIFYGQGDLPTSGNYSSRWVGKMPEINDSLASRQMKMASLDTKYSSLNNQMTDESLWQKLFSQGETRQPTMFHDSEVRRPTIATSLQKDSPLNKYTAYDQWQRPSGVSKYDNAYTFHTAPDSDPLETIGRELSMQDINRYQFHSSNSSEPGLPITHAAGDSSSAQLDSSSLTQTPRLFDFDGGETTTRVRSGAPVAPRVITPGGTKSYLPTRQNSVKPTALTVSEPSRNTLSDTSSTSGAAGVVKHGTARTEMMQSINGDKQIPVQYSPYELWAEER